MNRTLTVLPDLRQADAFGAPCLRCPHAGDPAGCAMVHDALRRVLEAAEAPLLDNRGLSSLRTERIVHDLLPHAAAYVCAPHGGQCAGGDDVEVFSPSPDRRLLCIHDINGHGTDAVPYRARFLTEIRRILAAHADDDLRAACVALNDAFMDAGPDDFHTIEAMLVEIAQDVRRLRIATLGAIHALLRSADGVPRPVFPEEGHVPGQWVWMGAAPLPPSFQPLEMAYEPGDLLVVCSDGFPRDDAPSQSALLRCIGRNTDPDAVADGIRRIVRRHRLTRNDDVSALCVRLA